MYIYVVYVMYDYTHAIAVSLDKTTAEKYAEETRKYVRSDVWVEKVEITNDLTELKCD